MAEGTIKKLTSKGYGFIKTENDVTCFSTHRASKASVSTTCMKANGCPTRKLMVPKAHLPRTSSPYSSASIEASTNVKVLDWAKPIGDWR